jgi:hypothetical protein
MVHIGPLLLDQASSHGGLQLCWVGIIFASVNGSLLPVKPHGECWAACRGELG